MQLLDHQIVSIVILSLAKKGITYEKQVKGSGISSRTLRSLLSGQNKKDATASIKKLRKSFVEADELFDSKGKLNLSIIDRDIISDSIAEERNTGKPFSNKQYGKRRDELRDESKSLEREIAAHMKALYSIKSEIATQEKLLAIMRREEEERKSNSQLIGEIERIISINK